MYIIPLRIITNMNTNSIESQKNVLIIKKSNQNNLVKTQIEKSLIQFVFASVSDSFLIEN